MVATSGGAVPVHATYPGGQLPLARRPVHADDWELFAPEGDSGDEAPVFDRRMVEGLLAQMGADLGSEEAFSDPKLQRAQALMYEAWGRNQPLPTVGSGAPGAGQIAGLRRRVCAVGGGRSRLAGARRRVLS